MNNIDKKEVNNSKASRMSDDEKLYLIELVDEKKNIIENKVTDKITMKMKQVAWVEIAKKFEEKNQYRSAESLQTCWKNTKKLAKQYSTKLKKQTMATGSGKKEITENLVFDAALNVMNYLTVNGLYNKFDNDAELTVDQLLNNNSDDYESDSAIFEHLLKNDQVPDWKKNSPLNLKSSVSEPLKINRRKTHTMKPYKSVNQNTTKLSPKDELTIVLKEHAKEKHDYEIQLLKLQIEKENLLIEKIKRDYDVDDKFDYENENI